jgi:2-polyprenyl-6-methoxyphenol hydroxylase-like FAD-dependent oxidoreductase
VRSVDRGQGLNHCICDVSNLLRGITEVRDGKSALVDAIATYEREMIPRGTEEVSCSVENGMMLHDWDKIQESPVFRRGFKPMDGHSSIKVETVEV